MKFNPKPIGTLLLKFVAAFGVGVLFSKLSLAALSPSAEVSAQLRAEIAQRFNGARIELNSAPQFSGPLPLVVSRVEIIQDTAQGGAQFLVRGSADEVVSGTVAFSAFVTTPIARHRIKPTEKLTPADFSTGDIDVSKGMAREYRGVMLSNTTDFNTLQARQTILEGQYPLTTSVEKIPDIRRGDTVRLRMTVGEITLTTEATAQEPGTINGPVRVVTVKSKREMVGQVRESGLVEVRL